MYSLIISVIALIAGYFLYGKIVEKVFRPDSQRPTPAITMADGVDYIRMPAWKVFMIQLLNIAGTGPIFGAIMGAMFGPSSYLWIVFGCIFGGAVHDYMVGMLSVRNKGANLPDIVGIYLGGTAKHVMLVFSAILLLLVGVVFVYSPAQILGDLTSSKEAIAAAHATNTITTPTLIWIIVVLGYYVVATLVPIDKIIGRIYPFFAFSLIFMAISLLVCLVIKFPTLPEVWDGLENRTPSAGNIFPCLFISIACGAISGFHGTQSPLMARCISNEKHGLPIFYGSMILEGIIALVWATISSWFFFGGGHEELGYTADFVVDGIKRIPSAPTIVTTVSESWLGLFGGLLALLGVVAAPITSGDTALRSVRLIVADMLSINQEKIGKRLAVSLPIFAITGVVLLFSLAFPTGFQKIWQYFGWANQTLAVFSLWAVTVFLLHHRKGLIYLMTMIPAVFMTSVSAAGFFATNNILGEPDPLFYGIVGISAAIASIFLFYFLTSDKISKKIHGKA